jgi:hypothetical protein
MENYNLDDELFGSLDNTLTYLDESSGNNNDGLYKVDLTKAKDKKAGYRAVIRFLPNITLEGKLGSSAVEKISHYVKIKDAKEMGGWFDSPRNFKQPCELTKVYYALTEGKNALLKQRAEECLNYSKRFYSYVLVIEDEQRPELVGKIMVMQYGPQINNKIKDEKDGLVSGEPCNIFHTTKGKDFVLLVKEVNDGEKTYPSYVSCVFKQDTSSIPVYMEGKGFKRLPVGEDGDVLPEHKKLLREFLTRRDVNLEDFAPKPLTEDQQGKITEIVNYLTGKTTLNASSRANAVPTRSDLDLEEELTTSSPVGEEITEQSADDFFNSF